MTYVIDMYLLIFFCFYFQVRLIWQIYETSFYAWWVTWLCRELTLFKNLRFIWKLERSRFLTVSIKLRSQKLLCQNFITKLCRVCLILGADISVLGVVFFLVQSSFFWHNLMQTRGLGSSFIWSHLDQDQRSWTKKKSLNIKSAPWNSVQ